MTVGADYSRAPACSASSRATRSTPTAPSTRRSARCSRASASRSSPSRASPTPSASPADFTPERYAEAEALKWAVTGPISVAGAAAGGAVAVDDPVGRGHDPGRRRPRRLHRRGPARVVGRRERAAPSTRPRAASALRRAHDAPDPAADRLPGCGARPRASCTPSSRGATAATWTAASFAPARRSCCPVEHDGAGLYFGDCKALMGDGEIVGPPEVGALVTASAEPREPPGVDGLAAARDGRVASRRSSPARRSSGAPARRSASCSSWVVEDYELERAQAALLLAMVAHAGICQISNTDYTAYCVDAARRARALRALAHEAARRRRTITWSTTPSRTASRPSWRLTQPQAWFGMTCRCSPSAGRSSRPATSTYPCSSLIVCRSAPG